MKATEWKPYESHVILQRLWGFLPLADITAKRLHMEIEQDYYWEPNRTTPRLEMFTEWPNGIPNGIPNHLSRGLPNDYRVVNGYSTEAAYRDGRREVDQDSLKHRRYWNQPLPEDFHWGRRIRWRRWQQKIIGKDRGRNEKSSKISTELPTKLPTKMKSTKLPTEKQSTVLPTEKQSTEMSTNKLTWRSPKLIRNHITEKHLQVHANCQWLPIYLIPHDDYRYCMKHAEALYEGSEEHKRTLLYREYNHILGCWHDRYAVDDWQSPTATKW